MPPCRLQTLAIGQQKAGKDSATTLQEWFKPFPPLSFNFSMLKQDRNFDFQSDISLVILRQIFILLYSILQWHKTWFLLF